MKYSLVWGGAWTVGGISGILAIQAGSSSVLLVGWGGGEDWTQAGLLWSVIHTLGEVLVFHHNFRHPHAHKREMYTHSSATQIHLLHSQHHKATSSSPAPTSTHPPSTSISLSLSLPASSLLPLSIIPTALFPQVSPPFYFLSSSPPTLHPSNPLHPQILHLGLLQPNHATSTSTHLLSIWYI